MEYNAGSGFDTLFRKSLTHILEKIFLSLDYESFQTCYDVSHQWKGFITSDFFQKKAKDTFSYEIDCDEMSLCEESHLGNYDEVKNLLSYGLIDVNFIGWGYYKTALHEAAEQGHCDVVKLLLDKGAYPNIIDEKFGRTPLHFAAKDNLMDVAKVLIDNGADPNLKDGYLEMTPLHLAVIYFHEHMVKTLLDRGADPNKRCANGETPLYLAAILGSDHIFKVLFDGGTNLEEAGTFTPLFYAVHGGQKEVAQSLLDAGEDPNDADVTGHYIPLHFAAKRNDVEMVRTLLRGGADPNKTNDLGETAMDFLAREEGWYAHNSESVRILVDAGGVTTSDL